LKAEADQIVQERVKRAFARLDTDNNGKISKEEARGLIKEHFDRIDTNKNGQIEFLELLQAARQRQEQKANEVTPHKQK
jgi:Ca2+-binding EF-hand superfamily protein